jgi:hypothetical protein
MNHLITVIAIAEHNSMFGFSLYQDTFVSKKSKATGCLLKGIGMMPLRSRRVDVGGCPPHRDFQICCRFSTAACRFEL